MNKKLTEEEKRKINILRMEAANYWSKIKGERIWSEEIDYFSCYWMVKRGEELPYTKKELNNADHISEEQLEAAIESCNCWEKKWETENKTRYYISNEKRGQLGYFTWDRKDLRKKMNSAIGEGPLFFQETRPGNAKFFVEIIEKIGVKKN